MRTVYAVSQGEYSDYSVLCVCEDLETAERFAAAYSGEGSYSSARVEELNLFPAGTIPQQLTVYCHNVEMWDNGRTEHRTHSYTRWNFDSYESLGNRPRLRFVRAPCHKGEGGRMEVRGYDAAAVEKVVNDRLAMWKAGAWITRDLKEFNAEIDP